VDPPYVAVMQTTLKLLESPLALLKLAPVFAMAFVFPLLFLPMLYPPKDPVNVKADAGAGAGAGARVGPGPGPGPRTGAGAGAGTEVLTGTVDPEKKRSSGDDRSPVGGGKNKKSQ